MSMSIQLVLLCVVTLSYIQLGRSDCDVQGLTEAVRQVLLPIMKAIKDDLNSVKDDFNSVKDDLNSVKRELTSLNETVSHLSGDLEQHKNQTASLLADLQLSINKSVTEGLTHVEDRLVNQVDHEMTSLNESMNRICDKMEEHEDHMTTEIMELEQYMQSNFTRQLEHSYGYVTSPPCDGTGGWRQAVYLDMTDPNTDCPEGWNMTDYSKRTCGRATDGRYTCDSVTFPVSGGEYSQVCGRIRAYQWGWNAGFFGSHVRRNSVNEAYFSGVAVMHGSPRQHIWTFVAGAAENYFYYATGNAGPCPCDGTRIDLLNIPSFLGEDYFCESGYIYPGQRINSEIYTLHSNDTLWDGRDCHSNSTCCSLHNPPYFTKTLTTSTTDDIELRMCFSLRIHQENTAIELVELYVK